MANNQQEKMVKVVTGTVLGVVIGRPLLGLMGLTLFASITILLISSPLLLISSPLLVFTVILFILAMAGFVSSVAMALVGYSAVLWIWRRRANNNRTISGVVNKLKEAGARMVEQGKIEQ